MLEKLEIKDGMETLLTLYSQGANTQTQVDNLFTELTGWRERTVEYETVPKLFGSGSFLVKAHNPQREIKVTALLRRSTNRYTMYHALYQAVEQRKALTFVLTSDDANLQQTMVGIPVGIGDVNTWGTDDITFTLTLLNLEGVFTTEVLPPQPDPDPVDPVDPDIENPAFFSAEVISSPIITTYTYTELYLILRDSAGENGDLEFYDSVEMTNLELISGFDFDFNAEWYTFYVDMFGLGFIYLTVRNDPPRGLRPLPSGKYKVTLKRTVGGDSITREIEFEFIRAV